MKDKLHQNAQEETDNLNRFIFIKEIKLIINNHPKQKEKRPDVFTGEFYETFKKEIIPVLHNHFQRIEKMFIISDSSYEVGITQLPK